MVDIIRHCVIYRDGFNGSTERALKGLLAVVQALGGGDDGFNGSTERALKGLTASHSAPA